MPGTTQAQEEGQCHQPTQALWGSGCRWVTTRETEALLSLPLLLPGCES